MARNVEIKARVADLAALEARVAAIADSGPVPIAQDDTFFPCDRGRLKLRAFEDGHGELIFYRRPDRDGPRTSSYFIARSPEADALRAVLGRAHGTAGRVVKRRTLYLVGRTRVHLDRVEGLGEFMELEVVLADGEAQEVGEREARALMARLAVTPDALVGVAYIDLLRAAQG